MIFKLGELFCGPGGIAHGAMNTRIEAPDGEIYSLSHAWANDYDKDTCDTYRANICPKTPESVICRDVRKLEPDTLERISEIDGLAFGFPCNDFSLVGEQKGMEGVYGPLYSYGIHMLRHFQPAFFVAENVSGLGSSDDGKSLSKILDELFAVGYNVVPHLYKFEKYGVPQARHRIIIVGIRADIGHTFNVPSPGDTPLRTAREAIEEPPIAEGTSNCELTRQSQQVIERLQNIKPGENAFNATLPPHLRLNVKGATISQIYRRLDPDKPAYTITGSGGGGTHVYHWKEDRALTNRERARLQTFPDDFVFSGSKESVRKQIGMAVPPDGAKVVFKALMQTFAGVEYPSQYANIPPRTYKTPPAIVQNKIGQLQMPLWERKKEYETEMIK